LALTDFEKQKEQLTKEGEESLKKQEKQLREEHDVAAKEKDAEVSKTVLSCRTEVIKLKETHSIRRDELQQEIDFLQQKLANEESGHKAELNTIMKLHATELVEKERKTTERVKSRMSAE
jgi:hypothetical protein